MLLPVSMYYSNIDVEKWGSWHVFADCLINNFSTHHNIICICTLIFSWIKKNFEMRFSQNQVFLLFDFEQLENGEKYQVSDSKLILKCWCENWIFRNLTYDMVLQIASQILNRPKWKKKNFWPVILHLTNCSLKIGWQRLFKI